jgi:D-alanyl-D-alanine dipeptidase
VSTHSEAFQERLRRAAEALKAADVDALLLTPTADMLYLSGFIHEHAFKRLLALVLRRDGSSRWITPAMNVSQVKDHALPGQPIRAWEDHEGYLPALREAVEGVRSVAFDNEARAEFLLDLLSVSPGVCLAKAGDITGPLRLRKDAAELELLRAAGRTVDDTISEAISLCRPGRTEAEIDEDLRKALRRRSPESQVAFTIIASGPNGAFPHHDTGSRALQTGDIVILDFGTRYQGYNSDITVTCSVGEPADPDARKVYRVVWEAQQKALEAVRPGVPCEEIDRAARSHIEAAGYGECFLHRTGHGLGLQLHEPPFMLGGNRMRLEEGMVFSVEPGIYLPGRFGIRLEVIASVAADGVSLINQPRVPELPVVPV